MDARGAWSFATLADIVLHHLPFPQVFERDPLNLGMVKEQVVPFAFHKSKAAIRDEPLDLALWHRRPPQKIGETSITIPRNASKL
jgi:hypothetical protein